MSRKRLFICKNEACPQFATFVAVTDGELEDANGYIMCDHRGCDRMVELDEHQRMALNSIAVNWVSRRVSTGEKIASGIPELIRLGMIKHAPQRKCAYSLTNRGRLAITMLGAFKE